MTGSVVVSIANVLPYCCETELLEKHAEYLRKWEASLCVSSSSSSSSRSSSGNSSSSSSCSASNQNSSNMTDEWRYDVQYV